MLYYEHHIMQTRVQPQKKLKGKNMWHDYNRQIQKIIFNAASTSMTKSLSEK
jgi:hypothetical protein